MPAVGSVTVLLMVRVGSRWEKENQRGLTHFLEHMPFKGTKKYPTTLRLSTILDSVGAEYNAFTGKEETGFWVKTASKHMPLALDVLSQLVFHPLIDEKEIEREKGVIIEEINMYEDQPMVKALLDFESLIYRGSALGWETIGTKQTVSSFQRRDFMDYLNQWYRPENMVIGIAGAIPKVKNQKSKVKNLIQRYFKTDKKDLKFHRKKEILSFKQDKPAINLRSKKTEQAHLCLGVRAFKRTHKNRWAVSVLNTILGGNMSSRLFIEVRERRGLAYYIKSATQEYLDNGYLVTRVGTDVKKAFEAVKVIWEEYKKITNIKSQISNIRKKELEKAKEYIKGKMILELEDSQVVAALYTEDWLLENKIHTPKEIMREIDKVTFEDVVRAAKEIFQPKNLNLSIVGPYNGGDKGKFEELLH